MLALVTASRQVQTLQSCCTMMHWNWADSLSFSKMNTDSPEETPALALNERLQTLGIIASQQQLVSNVDSLQHNAAGIECSTATASNNEGSDGSVALRQVKSQTQESSRLV
ncbi:unnamed protein product [Phytophthora lilii]|uniref:Unnamed protein product n=1 Tax=Phytophthora lilii TaxID=2077276 RepID=A0A9W6U6H1_9STRA|nr:unnamed protein product [Phytophthora lilii]